MNSTSRVAVAVDGGKVARQLVVFESGLRILVVVIVVVVAVRARGMASGSSRIRVLGL